MIFFDEIDFSNDKIYPSKHLPQWQSMHDLIKQQKGTNGLGRGKMAQLAKLGACDRATISKCLKKNLSAGQNIISIPIAKRIAIALKRDDVVSKLCPEYRREKYF